MSNKFTEKQYNKIIEIADEFEEKGGLGILDTLNRRTIGDVLFLTELASQIEFYPNKEIIVAIANPLTREWAHDKFVEKEKKYVWQSKQETDSGKVKRLYNAAIGITDSFKEKTEPIHNGNLITESEIKAWGYNPEMFDKEEV